MSVHGLCKLIDSWLHFRATIELQIYLYCAMSNTLATYMFSVAMTTESVCFNGDRATDSSVELGIANDAHPESRILFRVPSE